MAGGRALSVAASWCLLVYLVLQISLLSLALTWPFAAKNVWCLGAVQLGVLGTLAWAFVHTQRTELGLNPEVGGGAAARFTEAFALGGGSWRWVVLGVAAAVAFHAPVELVREGVERLSPTPEGERLAQLQLLNHDTVWRTVSLFLVIGLLGPALEEAFYRGCLWSYLERTVGGLVGWLFTSVVFALTHAAYRDWPSLLVVALVLGYLRMHSGSVWPGLAMHATFNSQSLLGAVTQTSAVAESGAAPTGTSYWLFQAASVVACVLVIAAIGRSSQRAVKA